MANPYAQPQPYGVAPAPYAMEPAQPGVYTPPAGYLGSWAAPAPCPPQVATKKQYGKHSVPVVPLQPGSSLVFPQGALKRVFLGIGWRGKKKDGGAYDVDCVAACYTHGNMAKQHTVWYGHQSNGTAKTAGKSQVVHTGDVLAGQGDGSPLEDLERIYIDLSNLPPFLDCVALESNLYNGQAFSELEDCYMRVVNADTNQEVGRLQLDTFGNPAFGYKSILFARLFRYKDRWVFAASCEGSPTPLQNTPEHNQSMVCPQLTPQQPTPPPMMAYVAVAGAPPPPQPAPAKKKGSAGSYALPALAVATAAGTAAAVALFATGGMSLDGMDPGNFTDGVDFGSLADVAGDLAGALGDVDWGGLASGAADFAGDAAQLAGEGLAAAGEGIADVGGKTVECLGAECGSLCDALGPVGDCCGDLVNNLGDLCGNIGEVFKCCAENAGTVVEHAGEVVEGIAKAL